MTSRIQIAAHWLANGSFCGLNRGDVAVQDPLGQFPSPLLDVAITVTRKK